MAGHIHHLAREHIVYSFDKDHPPALEIDSGDVVEIETYDARTGTVQRNEDLLEHSHPDGANPATGPIRVRGAEPGDGLCVEIMGIELAQQGIRDVDDAGFEPGRHMAEQTHALLDRAEVTVRIHLLKGVGNHRPLIETPELWVTTGEHEDLGLAARMAAEEMVLLMQEKGSLSFEQAYMLMSAAVDVQICQCCEPGEFPTTTRAVLRKSLLPSASK